MGYVVNATHDPGLRSWVESANDPATDFPIQNLPFGVFKAAGAVESVGVAIGDQILDIARALQQELFDGDAALAARRCGGTMLHSLLAMGRPYWSALRAQLVRALRADTQIGRRAARRAKEILVPQADATLSKPVYIGDFTEFDTSLHHVTNVGALADPPRPLPASFTWMPLGYHGRSSTIVIGGTPIRRPSGQLMDGAVRAPVFAPTRRLDYELEAGFFVGRTNAHGKPVPIGEAADHVFGMCLLNGWSAHDLHSWEHAHDGTFPGKGFATSISPWVVTMEALAPFTRPAFQREAGTPPPLPYLLADSDQQQGGLDVDVTAALTSRAMRDRGLPPLLLSRTNLGEMYWTPAQLLAHHTSNGCNLRYGDLLGSGALSGRDRDARGSLLELTWGGRDPITLPTGEVRRFLEDGDEVVLSGWCAREGFRRIGLGECRSSIIVQT